MALHLRRALIRGAQPFRYSVRSASTTAKATEAASQAAQKVGSAAGDVASKASEGLSRVQSSATSAARSAASSASSAASNATGRIGRLVGFAQSLVPPTVYYSKVVLELGKLIAKERKMTVPDLATFQSYAQPLLNNIRSPSALLNSASSAATSINPNTLISRIRNASTSELAAAGVIGAEIVGFFTVGQMMGRLKIVGYRSDKHAHGEH